MTAPIRIERIGDATLYLGDCLEIMPGLGRVDHIITDPPYEQSLHAAKANIPGRSFRTDGRDEISGLDFASIDGIRAPFVALAGQVCDGWLAVFCTVEGVARWADVINPAQPKYKRACIWIKPDSTPQLNGQGPAQGAECFVVAWCGKGYARWNAGGKRGIYTHNTNAKGRDGRHPTEKPVALMAEILADFTAPGDLILDPFMGSGTTGLAAMKSGRRFIGIERDATYFGVAVDRLRAAHALQRDQPGLFPLPAKQSQTTMDLNGGAD